MTFSVGDVGAVTILNMMEVGRSCLGHFFPSRVKSCGGRDDMVVLHLLLSVMVSQLLWPGLLENLDNFVEPPELAKTPTSARYVRNQPVSFCLERWRSCRKSESRVRSKYHQI